MSIPDRPSCCIICGYYLSTDEKYIGSRCVEPGHWQAAGLLGPRDSYAMARLVVSARIELARRPAPPAPPLLLDILPIIRYRGEGY
ncbi:MAG: hypothetical protein HYR94_02020 [Chloroflexi bacterium]|nr:hypothetical protein [Chloroflexota bacterium]